MPMKTSIIDGIPVFEALVGDENDGMVRISLVDLPAVMSDWQKFAGQQPQTFAIQSEEQRLIRGVIMRADFPIYRRDDRGEYYIIYRADTIREMAQKYLAENRANRVDTMHDGQEVDGVEMVQFFIKDTEKGVNPAGFEDIADGSLFAEFHCTNDEVWEQVKAGTFRGFSLEGFFSFQPDTDQPGIDEIVDGLAGQFSEQLKTDRANTMSKIAKTLERLRELLEADAATRVTMGRVTTDRGVLIWPGEEDLKAGDAVEILTDEDGNTAPAEDGDYITDDGKTIVVENGQVAEIRDPEAEVAPQGEEAQPSEEQEARKAERMARQQKFSESYSEKERKIWDAILAKMTTGFDGYIVDAGDNFAVADIWDMVEGHEKFYRYAVTWNEDGSANVSDPVEVRQAFVPLDFDDASAFAAPAATQQEEELRQQLADAVAANTTLESELEAARSEVATLRATPAAKPAHDEVKAAAVADKTGNKRIDTLNRLMAAK